MVQSIESIICDETIDARMRVKLLNMYEEKVNEKFDFQYWCWSGCTAYPQRLVQKQNEFALYEINQYLKDYKRCQDE